MDLRRYHFFCPTLKGEVGIQTAVSGESESHGEELEADLYEDTINSLLMGNQIYRTPIQKNIQQEYTESIGFLRAVYNDERFDMLKPPKKMIDDLNVSFHFQFYPQNFTVTACASNQVKPFPYKKTSKEIFHCIQLGKVSSNLCSLFSHFSSYNWVDGEILVRITDYRIIPTANFVYSLKISADIIQLIADSKKLNRDADLEYKKNSLLVLHPSICTDPSPDVSRVQSVLDCRKKMWIKEKEDIEPIFAEKAQVMKTAESVPKKHAISKISRTKPVHGIKIAPSILDMFANQK